MKTTNYATLHETIIEETLPNGLIVFLIPKPDFTEVSGFFATRFGGVDSDKKLQTSSGWQQALPGVAHFLEHRMFDSEKGQVFDLFSVLGAQSNAYTSHENTVYYFTATDHASENVELLLDFVQGFRVSEEKVDNEKDIIVQELRMYADMPEQQLYRGLIENMYAEHPYRIDIGGTEASVRATTKALLEACHRTFYHPTNMVLVIAGQFDVDHLLTIIRTNQATKAILAPLPFEKIPFVESENVLKSTDQRVANVRVPRLMIGYKLKPISIKGKEESKYMLAMNLLGELLFSKSGPYYETWVKNGWMTPSLGAQHEIDQGYNHLLVFAETFQPLALQQAIRHAIETPLDDQIQPLFERLKKVELGSFLRTLNSPSRMARSYLTNYLSGFDMFDDLENLKLITFAELESYRQVIAQSPFSVMVLQGAST